jgi:ABC-2 type transport system permease protein
MTPRPSSGRGFFRSAWLLAHLRAVELRNLLRFGGLRAWLWLAFLLVAGSSFFFFDWWFFHRMLGAVVEKVEFLAPFLLRELIQSMFLAFFGMIGLSTLSASVAGFYLSREIPFLLTTPLSPWAFITQRFTLVFVQSSWMVLVFGLPPFLAYREVMAVQPHFLAWLLPAFFLLLLIPALLGAALGIALMRWLPATRVKQVLGFFSLAFAAGIILLFRMSRPERLFMDVPQAQVMDFVSSMAVPSYPYLPTTWASLAVSDLGVFGPSGVYWFNLMLLAGAAAGSAVLFFSVFHLFYRKGLDTLDQGEVNREWRTVSITERLFGARGRVMGAYLSKDLLLFARDPGRWTQLFLLAALVVLYVYNARYFPLGGVFYRNLVAFLNLGLTGFVLSALCVRFVFPAVSLEGRSIWLTLSAPVPPRRFLWAKYLFSVVPLVAVSLVLTVSTNLVMGVAWELMGLFAVMAAAMAFALTGINLGLGAIYPRFRHDNEAQVSVAPAGVMAMILSLAYVVLIVILLAHPVYHIFAAPLKIQAMTRADALLGTGGALLLSAVCAVVPVRLGMRRASRWQEDG